MGKENEGRKNQFRIDKENGRFLSSTKRRQSWVALLDDEANQRWWLSSTTIKIIKCCSGESNCRFFSSMKRKNRGFFSSTMKQIRGGSPRQRRKSAVAAQSNRKAKLYICQVFMVGYSSLPSIKHISFFSILSSLNHCSSLPSSLSTHPLFFEIADSVELSFSQVPLFGTQRSEASNFGEEPPAERREQRTWTPTDDVVLISLWLNTRKYPVVGNEQRSGAFWKRIAAYFAASPKIAGSEHMEANHYDQATNCSPGVKAAKGHDKKTKAEGKALSEFQSMWSIKMEDLAMKERLLKMKLLDSLIASHEPLAEYEEALKKKLINDLLSN
uniref:No apical meristem-associated C-terminal domain-containing protein n=1 Tax=Brassica oleracea var. oleracea TaxID=109376 RepID=A0A0D3CD74_BRAOL